MSHLYLLWNTLPMLSNLTLTAEPWKFIMGSIIKLTNNLNAALEGNESIESLDADSLIRDLSVIPEGIRQAVRNNGGGHSNHTFF